MKKIISSVQNKLIKSLVDLQKSKVRKKSNLFGVEGAREINMALKNHYSAHQFFYCSELLTEETQKILADLEKKKVETFELSLACYHKIVVRKDSDGLYVLFYKKEEQTLQQEKTPLYLVLDGIEKPGNLGAILRSCDACNLTQVFLTNPKVDLYSPHVIRASLGACFSVSVKTVEVNDLSQFFNKSEVSVLLSYLDETAKPYYKEPLKNPTALVIGSEAQGISDLWLEKKHKKIIIPMQGQVDSLNASVATSILLFEAKRQREHKL